MTQGLPIRRGCCFSEEVQVELSKSRGPWVGLCRWDWGTLSDCCWLKIGVDQFIYACVCVSSNKCAEIV